MSDKPFLSIVIPVYQSAGVVQETVRETLENLSQYDVELVLVDDRSTDDSWDVISRIARMDSRITALRRCGTLASMKRIWPGLRFAGANGL